MSVPKGLAEAPDVPPDQRRKLEPSRNLDTAGTTEPASSSPATPRWLLGAYALLAVWGLGYLVLFFASVVGPR